MHTIRCLYCNSDSIVVSFYYMPYTLVYSYRRGNSRANESVDSVGERKSAAPLQVHCKEMKLRDLSHSHTQKRQSMSSLLGAKRK